MRRSLGVVLCLALGVTPGQAVALAAQSRGATTSVQEQLEAIPVYARVSLRLVDGRTLEGYLVEKSIDEVTVRPRREQGQPEDVPLSAIATIRMEAEGRGLSRGQKVVIAAAVAAAVAVVAWIWAVKSRAFGA